MNRFQIEWREFLTSAEIPDMQVLCRGEVPMYAPTQKEAIQKFRKAFPAAEVLSAYQFTRTK